MYFLYTPIALNLNALYFINSYKPKEAVSNFHFDTASSILFRTIAYRTFERLNLENSLSFKARVA